MTRDGDSFLTRDAARDDGRWGLGGGRQRKAEVRGALGGIQCAEAVVHIHTQAGGDDVDHHDEEDGADGWRVQAVVPNLVFLVI